MSEEMLLPDVAAHEAHESAREFEGRGSGAPPIDAHVIGSPLNDLAPVEPEVTPQEDLLDHQP